MSENQEKEKKLATNRLLDILRSQQPPQLVEEDKSVKDERIAVDVKELSTDVVEEQPLEGAPVREKELSTDVVEEQPLEEAPVEEKELSTDIVDEQSVEEKKVLSDKEAITLEEDVSSEIKKEPSVTEEKSDIDTENLISGAFKKKEISTGDLLSTLKSVQSGVSLSEEKKVDKETKTEPTVDSPKPTIKKLFTPESKFQKPAPTVPSNLLEQIQKPQEKSKPKELKEIQPIKFDLSLLSTLSERKQEKTIQDYLQSLFHLFNESQRRITIHHGKNYVRLLQIKTGFKRTEIEKAKEYTLPYKTEEGQIEDSSELIQHLFKNELDAKEIRYAYGAYFSQDTDTKTHILQAPTLSKKEISDLVDWNVKKNISFNPDEAIIAYETSKETVDRGDKHNIVIGISEKNTIEKAIDLFGGSKLKPRFISTLPVLLWKLFKRNYPDCKSGCYILVHLGENNTTVTLIKNQQLLLTREILFGAEDFYKAAMQKVVTENQSFKIEYPMAKQLLADYGIPVDTGGVTIDSHISLYKISIFLRPALERLTSELNRSMKYFIKQIPDIEWNEVFFDGICATFPNLVTVVGNNLNVKVGLLNPIRKGSFHVKNEGMIPKNEIPLYTINFALAFEEAEKINVISKKLRANFKYLFLYKVAGVMTAFFLPIYLITTILSGFTIKQLEGNIQTRSAQWNKLSIQAKEFIGLITDIDILNGYWSFLENDRKHSINQIKILKMFSTIVPKDIKLTVIQFKKISVESSDDINTTGNSVFKPGVKVSGFVQAEASVSDIHLTNFVMKLEQLNMFSNIDLTVDKTSKTAEGKLFFSLELRI